ncbi:MAG: efflux RND transporter periplasmic adaptor subunit, partial [Lachnospiraceae bacterium]|nr:efflux RND transporter periplasmic adaptor subunit [Lachnospiraceae bacterium]
MKKKLSRKLVIAAAAVLILAAVVAVWLFLNGKKKPGTVEVQTVSEIMGEKDSDQGNRFAGIIESKKSWSVNIDDGGTVGKVFVKTGDEVKKGTPLFSYDTRKMKDDLTQAEIDLQRLAAEQESAAATVAQLRKEKAAASAADQGSYTIQIQEQELEISQNEVEIREKKKEIASLRRSLDNATVKSKIRGVVKSIDRSQIDSDSGEGMDEDMSGGTAFMTIMQTSALRVKATVNEQNISEVEEGMPVTVYSRVDDSSWSGTISKVDTESFEKGQQEEYMEEDEEGSDETSSSSYPFYVDLDTTDGLMLGQHVYVEPGPPGAAAAKEGIWLDEMYIVDADGDSPYVWAANSRGRIKKRSVKLGD